MLMKEEARMSSTFIIHNSILRIGGPQFANNEEIQIYRQYLQIPTVHPNVDYKPAVEFLKQQADNLQLPIAVHYPKNEDNPVVVITWEGAQPELPTIMLNSHMDVVPVYEEYWSHPPFAAEMDENGDIYARGAQDTKALGMQYLAAIRALKEQGIKRLKRTVHVVFVPDEEAGGSLGMEAFVESDPFKKMNIGFALDEGGPAPDDDLFAFYAERTTWEVELIFSGQSGHGSVLFENTPGEKLSYVVSKMMEFRKEELRKIRELNYPIGHVTSINLTMLNGGVEANVVPAELSATFDIRISAIIDSDEFEEQVKRWCNEANGNIKFRTLVRRVRQLPTCVDDSNPFWIAFKDAVNESGFNVTPQIFPAGTDSRFIRNLNIPAIGFAPMMNTKLRAHDHNEYLNAATYMKGIDIFKKIIPKLAGV